MASPSLSLSASVSTTLAMSTGANGFTAALVTLIVRGAAHYGVTFAPDVAPALIVVLMPLVHEGARLAANKLFPTVQQEITP